MLKIVKSKRLKLLSWVGLSWEYGGKRWGWLGSCILMVTVFSSGVRDRIEERLECWKSRMLKKAECWNAEKAECWKSRMLKCWKSRVLEKQNWETLKSRIEKCGKAEMLKGGIQDMIGKSIVGKVIMFIRWNFLLPAIGHADHCSLERSWTECPEWLRGR